MQRPTGITLTALLMALDIIVGLVSMFLVPSLATSNIRAMGHLTLSQTLLIVRLGLFAIIAFEAFAVWSYWQSRFWARRLVLAGCVLYLYPILHLQASWNYSHFHAVMTVYGAVLAIFLLWYLNTRDVRAWFPRPLPAAS